jgi:hypothetical protein
MGTLFLEAADLPAASSLESSDVSARKLAALPPLVGTTHP